MCEAGAEKEVHQVLLLLPVPSITLEAADASQLKTIYVQKKPHTTFEHKQERNAGVRSRGGSKQCLPTWHTSIFFNIRAAPLQAFLRHMRN